MNVSRVSSADRYDLLVRCNGRHSDLQVLKMTSTSSRRNELKILLGYEQLAIDHAIAWEPTCRYPQANSSDYQARHSNLQVNKWYT